jgi:hypothetical protein
MTITDSLLIWALLQPPLAYVAIAWLNGGARK